MKEKAKRLCAVVLDPFCVQMYFLFFSFLSEIPLIMAYVQAWKRWGLVWAAAVILWDLFTERRCLKARMAVPVMGLLASYAVTTAIVIVVYPAAGYETALNWVCSFVTLLVLYPPSVADKARALQRLGAINWMLVILTTAMALGGLWAFFTQTGWYFYSHITDYTYPQGFIEERLTGLYRNAIYPSTFTGVAVAVIEWVRLRGKHVWLRLLLALCVIANVLHITLSNSRSLVLALAFFAAFLVLFVVIRRFPSAGWKRWVSGIACAAVVAGMVMMVMPHLRYACAQLPSYISSQEQPPSDDSSSPQTTTQPHTEGTQTTVLPETTTTVSQPTKPNNNGPVNVDRENPYGVLTGRPVIWRQGLDAFLERPVFGHGPFALKDEIRLSETSGEKLSHFHNVFIQSLVSVGVVGTVFFLLLLCGAAFCVLRCLFAAKTDAAYPVLVVMGGLLAGLVLVNLADTTLFFLSKNSEFVFWTYSGYAVLLSQDKPSRLDKPLRWLDERLTGKGSTTE